jgi:hypothetical protein
MLTGVSRRKITCVRQLIIHKIACVVGFFVISHHPQHPNLVLQNVVTLTNNLSHACFAPHPNPTLFVIRFPHRNGGEVRKNNVY